MRKAIILPLITLFFLANTAFAFTPTYQFTDQEKDFESGFYNFDAREYNPNIGRFLQPDPVLNNLTNPQKLKEITGQDLDKFLMDPQNLNPYSYTRNNPLRYTDPTGEWFKEFFTGRQSWSGFEMELGEAAMYTGPLFQKAMDHPYITGGIIGVGSGLTAMSTATLLSEGGIILGGASVQHQNIDKGIGIGTDFGKLGKVIENASGKITGFLREGNNLHGLNQIINRKVKPEILLDTVKNPMVRLQQPGDNILYLTGKAGVVLDKVGKVVTAYSANDFKSHIVNVLKLILKR
ncbi:RHS repeat-associated core domain-containing protein [Patescibacteria group bacterium]|nr:RHS repeat-associated core domain-containing protein [Patescibacteria group bacterium]